MIELLIARSILTPGPRCTSRVFAGSLVTAVHFAAQLVGRSTTATLLDGLLSSPEAEIAASACIQLGRMIPQRHECMKRLMEVLPAEDFQRREAEEMWRRFGNAGTDGRSP